MRVLLVGSGGREHAIAWKLAESSGLNELFIAPGNAGTGEIGQNLEIAADDIHALSTAAMNLDVDIAVIGPELPLVKGLTDVLESLGIQVFGPTKAAARIEGSKWWAKSLMQKHGIPTGRAQAFDNLARAETYVNSLPDSGVAIKADGLAAGKGVVVTRNRTETLSAISRAFDGNAFGVNGNRLLIEEKLEGFEVSVFAFVHENYVSPEIAACDYKRAGDGDTGPNTGGMGAYSPPEFWTTELANCVRTEILEPTARAMTDEGCPYRGLLYAGLMITATGPKVIEFNCRMGDPEAQVILPRLKSDLLEVCYATAIGSLKDSGVSWGGNTRVGVVIGSDGYPGKYDVGFGIGGLNTASNYSKVFHAGTTFDQRGTVVTSGGRVLTVVGDGADIKTARESAYRGASAIKFDGATYRKDIGVRAMATPPSLRTSP